MLSPEVEAAAREFAAWVAQTAPLVDLRKAQERLEADTDAQRLLVAWDQKQQELLTRQQAGKEVTTDDINSLRRLQAQIQNHPSIKAYADLQRRAQTYLADLSAEISQVLGVDFGVLSQSAGQ